MQREPGGEHYCYVCTTNNVMYYVGYIIMTSSSITDVEGEVHLVLLQ